MRHCFTACCCIRTKKEALSSSSSPSSPALLKSQGYDSLVYGYSYLSIYYLPACRPAVSTIDLFSIVLFYMVRLLLPCLISIRTSLIMSQFLLLLLLCWFDQATAHTSIVRVRKYVPWRNVVHRRKGKQDCKHTLTIENELHCFKKTDCQIYHIRSANLWGKEKIT